MGSMYTPAMPNRTMPGSIVIPVLTYENVEEAISWLCRVFGCTERWRAGSHRAQLAFGEGAIAVAERPSLPATTPVFQSHSIMVRVADVNAHYERSLQQGAEIQQPPIDFPYGERQYNVIDPGGHIWVFSQSLTDIAPEDWGGKTA
ncbi:MAG: VOC family protein [Chitinophagaceae bacterium]